MYGCIEILEAIEPPKNRYFSTKRVVAKCHKCGNVFNITKQNLTRGKPRVGCCKCMPYKYGRTGLNADVEYGRNINGFIDKSIIINRD